MPRNLQRSRGGHDAFDVTFTNNRTGAVLTSRDRLLSPRLGVIVKPRTAVSLYGSYTLTYLPRSGDQLSSLSLTTQALDPETVEELPHPGGRVADTAEPEVAEGFTARRSPVAMVIPRLGEPACGSVSTNCTHRRRVRLVKGARRAGRERVDAVMCRRCREVTLPRVQARFGESLRTQKPPRMMGSRSASPNFKPRTISTPGLWRAPYLVAG